MKKLETGASKAPVFLCLKKKCRKRFDKRNDIDYTSPRNLFFNIKSDFPKGECGFFW